MDLAFALRDRWLGGWGCPVKTVEPTFWGPIDANRLG